MLAKASSWTLAMGSWGSRGPLRKTGSCWGRCDQADPYGQLQALAGEARRVQQPLSCRLVRKFSFIYPENAHHKGKYYYTVDLLFDWFGFDQTSKTVVHSTCVTPLTLTKKFRNRRSRAVSRPYFVSVTRCKFH